MSSVAGASAYESKDPELPRQWSLSQIGAPAAWNVTTGAGVKIGIVDSGIDAANPEFAGRIDAMADCVGGPCRPGSAPDGHGHGTAVAGIAAARADNGVGMAGVAPDARLVVARALNDEGVGTTEDINNAIAWVVEQGAQVINLSLGDNRVVTSRVGSDLATSIEAAWVKGAIPVLAAGNYDLALGSNPSASYGNLDAVVVGASDNTGKTAWYSAPIGNAKWGLNAPGGGNELPGEGVLAPVLGRKYEWPVGTSMAAPHVTAALALLVSQGLAPREAIARLLDTADKTTPCGDGCQGRLKIDAAVAPVAKPTATPTEPGPTDDGSSSGGVIAGVVVVLLAAAAGTFAVLRRRKSATP